MTTNNPPIAAWAPSTALAKLASRRNNSPCVLTDGPAEFNDVALIRLSDYEALQAECEELGKELAETELRALKFIHRCNAHVELYQELRGERDHLQTECEKLRKDAEFGRSVLAKREPGKAYGCHCDLDDGMEPDGCVIDSGERHNCIYAKDISVKEQCEYWRVIVSDAAMEGDKP